MITMLSMEQVLGVQLSVQLTVQLSVQLKLTQMSNPLKLGQRMRMVIATRLAVTMIQHSATTIIAHSRRL
jgi:hypothetical protein